MGFRVPKWYWARLGLEQAEQGSFCGLCSVPAIADGWDAYCVQDVGCGIPEFRRQAAQGARPAHS